MKIPTAIPFLQRIRGSRLRRTRCISLLLLRLNPCRRSGLCWDGRAASGSSLHFQLPSQRSLVCRTLRRGCSYKPAPKRFDEHEFDLSTQSTSSSESRPPCSGFAYPIKSQKNVKPALEPLFLIDHDVNKSDADLSIHYPLDLSNAPETSLPVGSIVEDVVFIQFHSYAFVSLHIYR
jgi:hypothetical protein